MFIKTVIPAINNNILRGASVPVMAQFAQNYQEGNDLILVYKRLRQSL